jgi:peptidase E
MTKYILHGGETGIPNEHNKAFYQSWVSDFKSDFVPAILLVYFARPKDEWLKLKQEDKKRFAKYTNNRQANFIVAESETNTLKNQIKTANVVYVRGGSLDDVTTTLKPLQKELVQLLDGKIYAGSSAGVMVMANYTCSKNGYWRKGLSILPINSFVHWFPEFTQQLEKFKNEHNDNDFEWLLIPETEFIIKSY